MVKVVRIGVGVDVVIEVGVIGGVVVDGEEEDGEFDDEDMDEDVDELNLMVVFFVSVCVVVDSYDCIF